LDRFINVLIFCITLPVVLRYFHRDGTWSLKNGASAFRFFTVQSNVFCAVASLLMALAPEAGWAWTLKYVGTAAVTVTMLTVFVFLGPTQGYKKLLSGADFFLHLLTPLLAIFSFCVYEKRPMSFGTAMLGMLPVLLYGTLYLYKVIHAPEGKRWEDFYGFNKGGKWPIAFTLMLLGCFMICMAFMLIQNR